MQARNTNPNGTAAAALAVVAGYIGIIALVTWVIKDAINLPALITAGFVAGTFFVLLGVYCFVCPLLVRAIDPSRHYVEVTEVYSTKCGHVYCTMGVVVVIIAAVFCAI